MINIKSKIKFEKHNFDIFYYDVESVTNFEYLIVVMAIEAIEKKKLLSKVIEEFTDGANDLQLLLIKRFESMFEVSVEDFKLVEDQIKAMDKETKKLIPAKASNQLLYEPNLNLYLLGDSKLVDLEQIKASLAKPYSDVNNYVFNKIVCERTDINEDKTLDFELDNDLKSFSLLNLVDNDNQIILKELIDNLIIKSNDLINFEYDEFNIVKDINASLSTLSRKYGTGSAFIQLSRYDDVIPNSILEFDLTHNGKFILTEFYEYMNVPLIKENIFTFEEFRNNNLYNKLLNILRNKETEIDDTFKRQFLLNVNIKEEFELVREMNWYTFDEKFTFNQIDKMIKFKINMINDDIVIKNKFVNQHVVDNQVKLYEFLTTFFGEENFKDISEKKVLDILYWTFKKDSSKLLKKDYKKIEEAIKKFNLVNESISEKVKSISSMRSEINSEIDRLNDLKSKIDNDLESNEYFEECCELLDEISPLKRLGNFFVHILDSEEKSYANDIKAIKKYNKLFIDLKTDYRKYFKLEFSNESMNPEYINILNELEKKFVDTLTKAKNFK